MDALSGEPVPSTTWVSVITTVQAHHHCSQDPRQVKFCAGHRADHTLPHTRVRQGPWLLAVLLCLSPGSRSGAGFSACLGPRSFREARGPPPPVATGDRGWEAQQERACREGVVQDGWPGVVTLEGEGGGPTCSHCRHRGVLAGLGATSRMSEGLASEHFPRVTGTSGAGPAWVFDLFLEALY
ncbi:unnamed protein product [Rangifer tarandus platyrhynchus]|uniref:Uncharacterized protein n=1 Tax=Rangifer tarandus platyrhynchus TaxID=3082113 RepID=A0ABN8Y2L1_RANTA|nr:unnamed protein product [Rangifer tarandus platyrhynchus]